MKITKYCFMKDSDFTKIHSPVIGTVDMFRKVIDYGDATLWDSLQEIQDFLKICQTLPLLKTLPDNIYIAKVEINISKVD